MYLKKIKVHNRKFRFPNYIHAYKRKTTLATKTTYILHVYKYTYLLI